MIKDPCAKELFSYWVEEDVMFNTKVALYEAIAKDNWNNSAK